MDDSLHIVPKNDLLNELLVANVSLHQDCPLRYGPSTARRKVVQHHNRTTHVHQLVGKLATDITRSACNQNTHACIRSFSSLVCAGRTRDRSHAKIRYLCLRTS